MNAQDELLQAFRGHYGRLCLLVAQALKRGHDQSKVTESAMGKGHWIAPVYVELRRQRGRVDASLDRCINARVSHASLVQAGTEANQAVRQEWMMALPAFSERT